GTYQYQSGFPLTWNSTYYDASCGSPTSLVSNIGKKENGKILGLDAPAWDISCFYFHDAAVQTAGVDDPVKQRADTRIQLNNNVRYFPSRIDGIRTPELKEWALSLVKQVGLGGRVRAQFNLEVLNAFNQVFFNDAGTTPTG